MSIFLNGQKTMRPMHRILKASVLMLLLAMAFFISCGRRPGPKDYFPKTGRNAVYQRALDLRNNMNVLSIALRPGFEDFSALAYFRMGRGSRIMSAYVTNGEAGESDIKAEYPAYLANTRREEAFKAVSYLDGEVYFLNMTDIAAARDTQTVRQYWSRDSLQTILKRIITNFKPDMILLARDWEAGSDSPRWDVLYTDVLDVVQELNSAAVEDDVPDTSETSKWEVNRIFVEDGSEEGLLVPEAERHPRWGKTYGEIGEKAAEEYTSIYVQRRMWMKNVSMRYRLVFPVRLKGINRIDQGLTERVPLRLSGLFDRINQFTGNMIKGKENDGIQRLVPIMESVNLYLSRKDRFGPDGKRALFQWKWDLEQLRCALMGIDVEYAISESILTKRQLAYLTIRDVKGLPDEGNTFIYFPSVDKDGWIIDEFMDKKLELRYKPPYRILTPIEIEYDLPPGQYSRPRSTYGIFFPFYIWHQGGSEDKNFVYYDRIHLLLAPRFITEILTPIIRMIPEEKVVVRLTNVSRDGLIDTVQVDDPIAMSTGIPLRFEEKDVTLTDTLFITWKGNPKNGSYIIPVEIYENIVGNFVARKFDVNVNEKKSIGIITGLNESPLENAIRRFNVGYDKIEIEKGLQNRVRDKDVLIIDRRALTLKPEIQDYNEVLSNFVQDGGHLIVLAQDVEMWNENPLWEGIHLEKTVLLDENMPLQIDKSHSLFSNPNRIGSREWKNWLFLRGYHFMNVDDSEALQIPIKVEVTGSPLLSTQRLGQGIRTYVNLAMDYQWMNIHEGSFKLLANLISYE